MAIRLVLSDQVTYTSDVFQVLVQSDVRTLPQKHVCEYVT